MNFVFGFLVGGAVVGFVVWKWRENIQSLWTSSEALAARLRAKADAIASAANAVRKA